MLKNISVKAQVGVNIRQKRCETCGDRNSSAHSVPDRKRLSESDVNETNSCVGTQTLVSIETHQRPLHVIARNACPRKARIRQSEIKLSLLLCARLRGSVHFLLQFFDHKYNHSSRTQICSELASHGRAEKSICLDNRWREKIVA